MPTPKRFFRMVEAKPKKNGSPETKETITLPSWINRLYSVRTAFIGALISIHTASAGRNGFTIS